MNKGIAIAAFAAALSGLALYQAGTRHAVPSDLRDAVKDSDGSGSALGSLRSAGPAGAPVPTPVAAPSPAANQLPAGVAPVFDKDLPADLQRQLIADLAFAGTLSGRNTSPLHNSIFGQMSGPSYMRFFGSRIKMVGLNDWSKTPVVACVIPAIEPSKMWLGDYYVKTSHPQIARIMILFHESRHADPENENWRHVNCPDPFRDANGKDLLSSLTGVPLAGKRGCDVSALGSYGASVIMLKNIQRYCTNCTEKVRIDAGLYADDQLMRIVDANARNAIRDDVYR
jgi:hypothetical protein